MVLQRHYQKLNQKGNFEEIEHLDIESGSVSPLKRTVREARLGDIELNLTQRERSKENLEGREKEKSRDYLELRILCQSKKFVFEYSINNETRKYNI